MATRDFRFDTRDFHYLRGESAQHEEAILKRIYETTVFDRDGELSFQFMTLPSYNWISPPMPEPVPLSTDILISELQLPCFVLALLIHEYRGVALAEAIKTAQELIMEVPKPFDLLNPLRSFTEQVTMWPVVPVEQSPLSGQALATIGTVAARGGPIVLGSTVGILAAGPTPYLLLTVPTGLIFCGAGMAFSRWLYDNRDELLRKLLRVPPRQPNPARQAGPQARASRARRPKNPEEGSDPNPT